MAAGDITVVGTDKSTEANTTSSTIQWSDLGGGSAPLADDLAIVFVERNSASTDGATLPTNAGMTLVDSQTDGNSLFRCYKKVCTGSESGSITTTTTAGARKCIFGILLRGALDVEILTKGADTGTDANHTPPAATPTASGWGAIIAMGEHSGTATTATPPSGYTEAVEVAITGTAMSMGYLAYKGSAGLLDQLTNGVAETPGNIVSNASGSDVTYMTLLVSPIPGSAFTGTATLSGSGTLTMPTKVPSFLQTCAFTGSGSLTFSAAKPGLVNAATALSGTGALTLLGAPKWVDTLNFTGSGTLGAVGTPSFARTLALTGSGTLTTAQGPMTVIGATVGLAGAGTLTFAAVPKWAVTLGFTGSGTLGAVGIPVYVGTVSLSGSGTLLSTGIPKPITTLGLTGSGALTAAGSPKPIQALGLSGSGTLAADGLAAILASLALSGQGALSGAGTPAVLGTLGLSGSGQLTFTPVSSFIGSVALTGSGLLTTDGHLVIRRDLDLEISDPTGHALLYRGNYGYLLLTTDAAGNTVGYVLSDEDVEVHEPTGHTLKVVERES